MISPLKYAQAPSYNASLEAIMADIYQILPTFMAASP
jgi:hypothetical protein